MLTVLQGDALTMLKTLAPESVQCCVTSPPYWGLRDYGTAAWEGGDEGCDHLAAATGSTQNKGCNGSFGSPYRDICGKCGARRIDSQLGLEPTPEAYVAALVGVMAEVKRVLRHDGTLFLNLGDSYASGEIGRHDHKEGKRADNADGSRIKEFGQERQQQRLQTGLKPKDLVGIPWRVAFALQQDGWYLRADVIWAKPNPMPESVTDRPTKAHEYVFLLTKSQTYFYDAEAIKEKLETPPHAPGNRFHQDKISGPNDRNGHSQWETSMDKVWGESGSRNKRSVWTVPTSPYPDAHFATYPPDLIKPMILAGTSARGCCSNCLAPWERIVDSQRVMRHELSRNDPNYRPARYPSKSSGLDNYSNGGAQAFAQTQTLGWEPTCLCVCECEEHIYPSTPCTVLDPFAGSGTTGMVAIELGRRAILIELNPTYCQLIHQRCTTTIGLPLA